MTGQDEQDERDDEQRNGMNRTNVGFSNLMSTNFEGLRSGFEDSLIGKAQAGQAVVQTLRFWGRWCPGKRR
jgi:hypothetical protein